MCWNSVLAIVVALADLGGADHPALSLGRMGHMSEHETSCTEPGVGSSVQRKKEEKIPKRVTTMVAAVAVMVALFATAAYAASTAIYGTNDGEFINESPDFQDDRIYALGGNDYINAVVTWTMDPLEDSDADKLFGGKGNDDLAADDGDGADVLIGGPGSDRCWGTPGDSFAACEFISREPLE